jgi:acyl-CoA synthetase (AMP-forming)/AMP-acid ligase II
VGPTKRIPAEFSKSSLSWGQIFSDSGGKVAGGEKDSELPRCVDVDLATLIYTSGSTGEPKGVMSTHHNMISAARSIIQYVGNVEDDIILDVLPLSFDYGLYQVIMAFMFSGTVVLEKSFLYLHRILERIAQEKVTGFPIVPTIVAMLLKLQDLTKYDFSTLRYMTNTGAALPVEHIRRLRSMFPQVTMVSMFGLTECKRVCYLPPEELDRRPSSVGKAMPNCEVFVVDEDGQEVAPGQTGELIIRGSNVMQGYWADPKLTAKTYRDGAYPSGRILYSGDYFRRDEQGFLYFLGRKDDMIKSKGERISAKEVENNICGMEGVAEVAVIGMPDEIFGQAIKVYIVPAPQVELTEKQVLRYCSANMETFMVPKYVEFLDCLPKTPNGKIDKKRLKSEEKTT